MMAGSFALLFDPIFQGMAVSLLFGPVVSTSLTLIAVPLGCLTAHRSFACPRREEPDIAAGPMPGHRGGGVPSLAPSARHPH
jgi:hypothetical protein